MKPCNGFIVSIFLLLLTTPFSTQAQDKNCRKVDVSVDITHSQNGQGGSIKVEAKNSGSTFVLHLLAIGDSKKDQVKIKGGVIDRIPPGTYDLIIQATGKGYCSETRQVTVN